MVKCEIMQRFGFKVLHSDGETKARIGTIVTSHGIIDTPAFVPVGTQAAVKSLTPDELKNLGVQLFFVNTYHTYLRPGLDVIKKIGGLHKFMGWNGPIITDSGGFQVFSLARPKYRIAERSDESPKLVKITENGVEFRSHWDGSLHTFTPESSMSWQWELGSDIHIAFDDCTSYPVTHAKAKTSTQRTHRWAVRSLTVHEKLKKKHTKLKRPHQALYGVIQGSVFEDLRKDSAKLISSMNFDGIAIGGVSVGESKAEMRNVLTWVAPHLPQGKPRHLLGVGEIDDIFTLVEWGIDTFDCVQPTRLARMGKLLVRNKRINKFEVDISKKEFAQDTKPIDLECQCSTCRHFSGAYLHHLFRVRELLAYRLATVHNVYFINSLMKDIRIAITQGKFLELKKQWLYDM